MSSYREVVYMIHDQLKNVSDDAHFENDHIIYLIDNWRSTLLKQRYSDVKRDIPIETYQELCIDLEYDVDCISNELVRSVKEIPPIVNLNTSNLYTFIDPKYKGFGNIEWIFIDKERLKYVGNNKWLKNFIYFAIAGDRKMYLNSANINFKYIKSIKMLTILSNPKDALEFNCNENEACMDVLDMELPLESDLIPILIEIIIKELSGAMYRPRDIKNDAQDNLNSNESNRE